MSIIIHNTGYVDFATGLCDYSIRINNDKPIATFRHKRGDGLAVCLSKAAVAVHIEQSGTNTPAGAAEK